MAIDKEFKTIDEQVLLLKSRNLQFNDEKTAKELLKKYNYFDIINGTENILLKSFKPKDYVRTYNKPPFWVIIKDLSCLVFQN